MILILEKRKWWSYNLLSDQLRHAINEKSMRFEVSIHLQKKIINIHLQI